MRKAFVSQQWSRVFTGNRTRLKVVGFERLSRSSLSRKVYFKYSEDGSTIPIPHLTLPPTTEWLLPNVSSLDMSFHPLAGNRNVHGCNISKLLDMLPNLEEINLNYMRVSISDILIACPKLQRFSWSGSHQQVLMNGYEFSKKAYLTELCLDNSQFMSYSDLYEEYSREDNQNEQSVYILQHCSLLERLSIKNATFIRVDDEVVEQVSQEMLIKMVRHHSSLRWLKSDLTEANVAMLQQERPDVVFVSE